MGSSIGARLLGDCTTVIHPLRRSQFGNEDAESKLAAARRIGTGYEVRFRGS